jgi:AraC family transcriptional regulator
MNDSSSASQALAIAPPRFDKVVSKVETTRSSLDRGWKQLQLHVYNVVPQPEVIPSPIATNAHTLPVLLQGTCKIQGLIDGRKVAAQTYPGTMSLTPLGVPTAYTWTETYVLAHLYLSPALTLSTANDLTRKDPEHVELVPTSFFRDAFIEQVCLALLKELESEGLFGSLYADTLAQALNLHLLRHYSSLKQTKDLPTGGLSQQQLKQVTEYIEAFLDSEVDLEHLAALSHVNPASFCKQFKRTTGLPPHQYVIFRRVERAKELLIRDISIAEVAQLVGFFDQSHLIRHFKYWVGVSPKDYRQGFMI